MDYKLFIYCCNTYMVIFFKTCIEDAKVLVDNTALTK